MIVKTWSLVALIAFACPTALVAQDGAQEKSLPKRVESEDAKKLEALADAVVKEVEEIRGAEFKRPVAKGVYTEAQLSDYLQKKLFEEEYGGGKLERQEWMLTQLGYLPKGMKLAKTYVDVLLSQIGGFYDPEREAFFMLERAARYGDFVNRMMIAHELTHALDDQFYGLQARMKRAKDHDEGFAIGAVIEGSATALMYRWQSSNASDMNLAEMKDVAKREMESAETLRKAPPYFHVLVARYMAGASFFTKGEGMRQILTRDTSYKPEVDAAFAKQPVSSEQILHPKKYWSDETRDDPVTIANLAEFEAKIEKRLDAKIVERDTMGEIHMAILGRNPDRKLNMGLMVNAAYWSNRAARGWGGDEVWVLQRQAGEATERGMLWLTFWDTEKDREEFQAAYAKHYGERVAVTAAADGRLLVYAYGFARELGAPELLELTTGARLVKGSKEVR